jgi:hypothetical protein
MLNRGTPSLIPFRYPPRTAPYASHGALTRARCNEPLRVHAFRGFDLDACCRFGSMFLTFCEVEAAHEFMTF